LKGDLSLAAEPPAPGRTNRPFELHRTAASQSHKAQRLIDYVYGLHPQRQNPKAVKTKIAAKRTDQLPLSGYLNLQEFRLPLVRSLSSFFRHPSARALREINEDSSETTFLLVENYFMTTPGGLRSAREFLTPKSLGDAFHCERSLAERCDEESRWLLAAYCVWSLAEGCGEGQC